jgi:polyhydroxyalkanoate synthesis regulator phasin
MAKKDKKKNKKGSDAADAVEAVRSAVERTFQATTEGAAGTQKRTRALVDEVTHAAARIRETIEDLRILEDVRGLRGEIESLARRVAALEGRLGKVSPPSRPAPAKPASRPAKRSAKRAPAKASARPKAKARAKTSARAKTARAKPSSS